VVRNVTGRLRGNSFSLMPGIVPLQVLPQNALLEAGNPRIGDSQSPHRESRIQALEIPNPSIGNRQSPHWKLSIQALGITNPCTGIDYTKKDSPTPSIWSGMVCMMKSNISLAREAGKWLGI